jgi:phosphoribosylformimino-5-aminoimidazole carboxamide ribotide isomerase
MKALGVRWVVCTDVRRDGLLTGPSTSLTALMVAEGFDVIAAGGISSVEDVARVRETGAAGCIIGRALYTGAVSLPEAMEAARAD